MTKKLFRDGFPKTALEAVEASYFLSKKEKDEWKDWIKDASDEHKDELVDTLHAMWTENEAKKPKSVAKKPEPKKEKEPKKIKPVEKDTIEVPRPKADKKVQVEEVKKVEVSKPKNKFFDISSVKASENKSAIDNIYQEFKNTSDNQERMLQKMMDSFVKFDRLETYFEILASRTNELNDIIVEQAKKIVLLENRSKEEIEDDKFRQQALQDQIDDVERKVEVVSRDSRTLRKDFRDSYKEFSTQLAASSADIYKTDGIFEKISILTKKLDKLEAGKTHSKQESKKSEKAAFVKAKLKPKIKTSSIKKGIDSREWL